MKQKFLVTYDISETKIRNKLSNLLSKFGNRVQLSCFEIECTDSELKKILSKIEETIDPSTDSVFFFPITKNMENAVLEIGIKRDKELLI